MSEEHLLDRREVTAVLFGLGGLFLLNTIENSLLGRAASWATPAPEVVPTPESTCPEQLRMTRYYLGRTEQYQENPCFREFVDSMVSWGDIHWQLNQGPEVYSNIRVPYQGSTRVDLWTGVLDRDNYFRLFSPAGIAAQAGHLGSLYEDLDIMRSGVQLLPNEYSPDHKKKIYENMVVPGYFGDRTGRVKAWSQEFDIFNQLAEAANPLGETDPYYQPKGIVRINLTTTQAGLKSLGYDWKSKEWVQACAYAFNLTQDEADCVLRNCDEHPNFRRWLISDNEQMA